MAKRPIFLVTGHLPEFVTEKLIEFEWFPGFSVKQKQRSIKSFHANAKENMNTIKILEVSSKSDKPLGISLSAFNLNITTNNGKKFSVETAFQASKVFTGGGPYLDLYEKTSREAKKDSRLKTSGELQYFQFFNRKWDLEPKTLFYDWLYMNALAINTDLAEEVLKYDAFTDIEFNPQKSINCQARSVALFVSLNRAGLLKEALSSVENYKKLFQGKEDKKDVLINQSSKRSEQLSIFDEYNNKVGSDDE
ncbi:DUF6977 family protein [Jeotgalibacillus sp. JSM ZJ347]|uniref:DarT1-associated NADAR antitoxin family protein n=1 Tax=Jeotgalibacillus sp. JSM ZJ347 TaxID=3342117 RepID=UPI0035A90326